ncbi:MAG: hypothetical protein ONB11_12555 [candidate division KSB1 bacterium]|nr:hypothetical protein [candidate division KSB1 bacterium]
MPRSIPDLNAQTKAILQQIQQDIAVLKGNQTPSETPPFIQQASGGTVAIIQTPVADEGKAWVLKRVDYSATSLSSAVLEIKSKITSFSVFSTLVEVSITQLQGAFDFGAGLLIPYWFNPTYEVWMPTELEVSITGGSGFTLSIVAFQVPYSPV